MPFLAMYYYREHDALQMAASSNMACRAQAISLKLIIFVLALSAASA